MARRIILISSCPVSIVLVALALVIVGIGRGQPANSREDIEQATENIFSLIDKGNFSEADPATDELVAGFDGSPDLPEMLYEIGARYERLNRFDEEKRVFQKAIQSRPDSPYANKARLGIPRAEAMSLIMSEKFEQAKLAIDIMMTDYKGHPDFPEVLFWITGRFVRVSRFEDAKRNYQRIVQNFPDSPWADRARFCIAEADVTSLIMSKNYDQAQKALDKLAVDFAGSPDLPEASYWITERFERQNRFEEAKNNYQKIVQNHPGHPIANRAKLGVSRATVMSLIVSGDYDGAKEAIDKMVVDFAGNPALPGTLYWLTERYEWADKLDEAKYVYQQIIQKCPDSIYTDRARLGIRRLDVMKLMALSDGSPAEEALSRMIVDFNDDTEMPRAVLIVGAKCFLDAKTPV